MSTSRLRLAIAGVAVAGLALTVYLTATSLLDTSTYCPTSGCDVVLSSRYSELFGIPISLFGAVGFLAILASAAHPRGALLGVIVAVGGIGYALYLVAVQVAVIGTTCALCMTSHGLLAVATALAVVRLSRDGSA
jgi:uncharacterized membrane protein